MKRKAYAYVLRAGSTGADVLVFTHRDHPEAGVQVPKGSIEPDESPADAARREALEEVGLSALTFLGAVGHDSWRDADGAEQERHFYAFRAPADVPSSWEHRVTQGEEDAGLVLRCAWMPLAEAQRILVPGHAAYLAAAATLLSSAVTYSFAPLAPADIAEISAWRYDGPYSAYSMGGDPEDPDEDDPDDMLDQRSPYYAVRDADGHLVGYFAYGTAAEPWDHAEPTLYANSARMLAIGLGMRPDLTGRGLGLAFVRAGLAFATGQFTPASFHLYVYPWNARARRVYERAGFASTGTLTMGSATGQRVFVEMRCPARV